MLLVLTTIYAKQLPVSRKRQAECWRGPNARELTRKATGGI